MIVIKRDGRKEEFDLQKVISAVTSVYQSCGFTPSEKLLDAVAKAFSRGDTISVEEIQDKVENLLMNYNHKVAKAFILYRQKHAELRFIKQKADYIESYEIGRASCL